MFTHIRLSPSFQRLAWSNFFAQCAEQISLAAAPLIAVFVLGAGAGETGLLQTAQTLPFLLLSLIMGVWVDRHSRRKLMIGAEILRVFAMIGILALLGMNLLTLPLLAIIGFIGATSTVAYSVAAPSLVTSLVPRNALALANGRIELARSVAYTAGPAAGGMIVGWIGGNWAYGLAASLSAFAVILLRGIPEAINTLKPKRHFFIELGDGAGFVFKDKSLRTILITAVLFNIGYFLLQAIYVVYAARHLAMSPSHIGISLAIAGIGMVIGALIGSTLSRWMRFGRMLIIGPICGFFASIVMLITIVAPSFWLVSCSLFLLGIGPVLWVISSTTLRQAITPQDMLGRVSAIISTATYGARPIGALLGAYVATQINIKACLLLSSVAFLAQLLVVVLSPVARLNSIPERLLT